MGTNDGPVRGPRIALFGAPLDTGNLGVSALGESVLQGIGDQCPDADVLVFDNARGRRHRAAAHGLPAHDLDGAWNSRRLHRSESLWSMWASSLVGLPRNRNVDSLRQADQVLDISGGDSFTDLYGPSRWRLVSLPKRIALRAGAALTLLPQTYGPFRDDETRTAAARIVRAARSAWARDVDSFATMQELLGDHFDPARHRLGVDVAFALRSRRPDVLPEPLSTWLEESGTTVGLNVSGLVLDDPGARERFGLAVDYRAVVTDLARRLLDAGVDRLMLVPHVRGTFAESDDRACAAVAEQLDAGGRVQVLPPGLDAGQTKWCISRTNWFCGTRMHATIAALSSGVPTAAIAYSPKARGVFASCGVADAVVDARSVATADATRRLLDLYEARERQHDVLDDTIDGVVTAAREQFVDILAPSMASAVRS